MLQIVLCCTAHDDLSRIEFQAIFGGSQHLRLPRIFPWPQDFGQRLSRVRVWVARDVFGGSRDDDHTTAGSPFRTHVDDPVGSLDHIQIVLNDQHGVAIVDEAMQNFQQLLDIHKVETRRGFIQQVDRAAGRAFAQLASQFYPLRFTAREGWRGLSQLQVVESDGDQCLQQMADLGDILEVLDRLLDVHVEDFGNVLAFKPDFERFVIEPPAFADGAGDPDVGQEVHLQLVRPVPFARFATSPCHVEAEASRCVASQLGVGQYRIQIANQVKQFDIGRRIRSRSPPDG